MTYDKDSFLAGLSVGMSLRYSKRIPAQNVSYLTFSSINDFTLSVANSTKNWDGTVETSTDAINWGVWDGATTLTATQKASMYWLYVRGSGNTKISASPALYARWVLSGNSISCDGDIRTLLNYSDVENTNMAASCFMYMFYNCSALTRAPSLPATVLASSCYSDMFHGCTSLLYAPILPATTLANYCYANMFRFCTSLVNAPALSATTMKDHCYSFMFDGCAGIKLSETQMGEYQTPYRIPISGTGTDANRALYNMFSGTFTGTPTINTTYYTPNTVI